MDTRCNNASVRISARVRKEWAWFFTYRAIMIVNKIHDATKYNASPQSNALTTLRFQCVRRLIYISHRPIFFDIPLPQKNIHRRTRKNRCPIFFPRKNIVASKTLDLNNNPEYSRLFSLESCSQLVLYNRHNSSLM